MSAPSSSKRKATAAAPAAKRARTNAASSEALVASILASGGTYAPPRDPADALKIITALAQYARSLEEDAAAARPAPRSAEQLAAAAEKLRAAVRSGIKKQMAWKPSCKQGSARWLYDGVCADGEVFGALLNLGGPPGFKMKKMPKDDFEAIFGYIEASIRYGSLRLTGTDVNIHWKADEGTFKFSGTYGL